MSISSQVRLDGYHPDINQYSTIVYEKHGDYHRTNGPALLIRDGSFCYLQYGAYHRTDGPAVYSSTETSYACRDIFQSDPFDPPEQGSSG